MENQEYCLYLTRNSRNGFTESFLQTIPNYLDENTNVQVSDIVVFNYLVMKYLKEDMGQPTLFDVTYDRYIKQHNPLYGNRIVRGKIFTQEELEVLREIIARLQNLFRTNVVGEKRKQFLISFLNQILQGAIPFSTPLSELCKYHLY